MKNSLPLMLLASVVIATETDYRPLRMARGEFRPFAEQHDLRIAFTKGNDLIASGTIFGSRLMLHKFLGLRNGLPVYDEGTWISSKPKKNYIIDGENWIDVDKTGIAALFDVDGDGVEDALRIARNPFGFPAHSKDAPYPFTGKPWNREPSAYGGPGKGYDIRGKWLGDSESVGELYWAKGTRNSDGTLSFGKQKKVLAALPDVPLAWKSLGGITAVGGVGRWFVLHGAVDELMAVPFRMENGEAVCGEARPFLKSGWRDPLGYLHRHLLFKDIDGDGKPEMFADGNPGCVCVYKGDKPGQYEALGLAQCKEGPLAVQTLASPCLFDWDGDGKPDLITGDSSGYLQLWLGTANPLEFKEPLSMTVCGVPVKAEAGPSGSIQGPGEKRWGYLKVAAGNWNGAKVLITCDIKGDLFLWRPSPEGVAALSKPVPFTKDGNPFKCAWRSRPAIVPASSRFMGIEHDALLIQDWDGDIALAYPAVAGGTDFVSIEKLKRQDGSLLHMCGNVGWWGRGHIALDDWDGDGKLDIVFGSNRDLYRFFEPDWKPHGAVPYIFRNEGTNEKPLFSKGACMRLKNGKALDFGCHNATPWLCDINGDGKKDLLVGAENGRVYVFFHDELELTN